MRVLRLAFVVTALFLASPAARSGVSITLDRAALDVLLGAVAAQELTVPLSAERSLRVQLEELKVLGLEPDPGPAGRGGRIRTSLKLVAPQLGLSLAVRPAVALKVVREGDVGLLEVRFEDVPLATGFGTLDLALFLPALRYPVDGAFELAGAHGDVAVHSRVVGVVVTESHVRLDLDLSLK